VKLDDGTAAAHAGSSSLPSIVMDPASRDARIERAARTVVDEGGFDAVGAPEEEG
jgi:hypothetical protein